MKALYLILIFMLGCSVINSQSMRFGIAGNFLVSNKYYTYQFGPSALAEYSFKDIPISINGSIRVYISELSKNHLPGYNNNILSIGTSINYYPLKWSIMPFIGIGVSYNSNSLKPGGMPAFVNGNILSVRNADENISFELTGGIKFSAASPVNFIVEVTQTFSKSGEIIITNNITQKIEDKKEINIFNSLFLKLGILFQI